MWSQRVRQNLATTQQYICVCICIYVCIYVCICMYVCIHIHMYMCMYIHTCILRHTCIYVCIHTRVFLDLQGCIDLLTVVSLFFSGICSPNGSFLPSDFISIRPCPLSMFLHPWTSRRVGVLVLILLACRSLVHILLGWELECGLLYLSGSWFWKHKWGSMESRTGKEEKSNKWHAAELKVIAVGKWGSVLLGTCWDTVVCTLKSSHWMVGGSDTYPLTFILHWLEELLGSICACKRWMNSRSAKVSPMAEDKRDAGADTAGGEFVSWKYLRYHCR